MRKAATAKERRCYADSVERSAQAVAKLTVMATRPIRGQDTVRCSAIALADTLA
jgi:hypothetical protein